MVSLTTAFMTMLLVLQALTIAIEISKDREIDRLKDEIESLKRTQDDGK